jgi:hypothetical protein
MGKLAFTAGYKIGCLMYSSQCEVKMTICARLVCDKIQLVFVLIVIVMTRLKSLYPQE